MVGRPPFQPDDFIDIHVENDQVCVDLDQRLQQPPRLTGPEAAALAAAAELLRPAAGDALASALAKLERVLPAGAKEMYREMGSAVDARSQARRSWALTRAVQERREVDVRLRRAGQDRRREAAGAARTRLFSHRGPWYLYGWDLARGRAPLPAGPDDRDRR